MTNKSQLENLDLDALAERFGNKVHRSNDESHFLMRPPDNRKRLH